MRTRPCPSPGQIATLYFLVQLFRPIELHSGFAQQTSNTIQFPYYTQAVVTISFSNRLEVLRLFLLDMDKSLWVLSQSKWLRQMWRWLWLQSHLIPCTYGVRTRNTCPQDHTNIKQRRTETISFDEYPFNRSKCQCLSCHSSSSFISESEWLQHLVKEMRSLTSVDSVWEKWFFYSDAPSDAATNPWKHESMSRLFSFRSAQFNMISIKTNVNPFHDDGNEHIEHAQAPLSSRHTTSSHTSSVISVLLIYISSWFVDSFYSDSDQPTVEHYLSLYLTHSHTT